MPPEGFFPKPYPLNLLTVPACNKCNNDFSKDEDYARTILSSARMSDEYMPEAEKIWEQKVAKSLKINKKVAYQIYKSMESIDENNVAFKIDRARIDNVITKIVKGLFYFHHNEPLDRNFHIAIHLWSGSKNVPTNVYPDELIVALLSSPIATIGNNLLRYRRIHAIENINFSVWLFSFYNNDSTNFVVWTTDKNSNTG